MKISMILSSKNRNIIRQLVLYGLIGIFSASIDSLVFARMMILDVNIYLSNFISVNIGIFISFILNTYFNFKIKDSIQKRLISFFSIGYIGMFISTLILYIGNSILMLNIIMVKLVSIVIVAVIQFILNKLLTYREK